MSNKEKANLELTLKNLLYCVDDANEQNKMISILEEYNDKLPDGKVKDWLQKLFLKMTKKDYYSKVDYLVDDILSGKLDNEKKKIIYEMLNKLQPVVEKAEKSFWDKLCDLFKWS